MRSTTGHPCPMSGIWQSKGCHPKQIALSKGEVFPPCRDCHRAVTWVLIRRTQN